MEKDYSCIAKQVIYQEVINNIKGLAAECRAVCIDIGLPNLVYSNVTKMEIKSSISDKIENEFRSEMDASIKVRDRLSDNTDDNSYINRIPIPLSRVWIRYRARAIAGVKGNFRHSWDDLACRYCDLGDDESQEHLEMCGGTEFERRGLEMRNWRDRLLFWRRMTVKIAAVTKKKGPVT